MKNRKKLNFWVLLPKISPWIMAIWALKYSALNTEQTIIMIVACLTVCFGLQALAEDFGGEGKSDRKRTDSNRTIEIF